MVKKCCKVLKSKYKECKVLKNIKTKCKRNLCLIHLFGDHSTDCAQGYLYMYKT